MYTHEWMMAAATQAICGLLGIIICKGFLQIRFTTALLAALLCCSMPLGTLPGFGTPFIAHDLLLPIIMLLVMFGRPGPGAPLCWLVVTAAFLWPTLGTFASMLQGSQTMVWVTFLFRRVSLALFFVAGVAVSGRRIRTSEIMEACVAIWIFMAIAGTFQYLGLINIDPLIKEGGLESIEESTAAQRGFLALNRAAVGVWGSAIFGYSLSHIVLNGKLGLSRTVLHTVSIAVTVIVVLFSGSRTGAVALAVAAGFIAVRSIPLLRYTRPARVLLFGAVALVAAQPILIKGAGTISKRMEAFQELHRVGSFQERVETQRNTLKYVLGSPQALLLGMGPELVRFKYLVGTSLNWPHSEYVFTLWLSGLPGLFLYVTMLIAMFVSLRQIPSTELNVDAIAGQTILVGGAIMGLTDGCLMIAGSRLAPFGLLMFFFFGLIIRDCVRTRAAIAERPAYNLEPAMRYARV